MITNEKEFLAMARHRANVREQALTAEGMDLVRLRSDEAMATIGMDEYDRRANPDRKGRWMMNGRRRFWPEDPRPQDIHIDDIAHGLSMLNRFNGRTKRPFSVAQHSALSSGVPPTPA